MDCIHGLYTANTYTSLCGSRFKCERKKGKLRSLSNNDGDGYENVSQKVCSRCFRLYRAYSISFCSSDVGEERASGVVIYSVPPQNVKLGSFSL